MAVKKRPQASKAKPTVDIDATFNKAEVPPESEVWSVRVPKGLKEEAKIFAVLNHMNLGQLVSQAVQEYLENHQSTK